MKNRLSPRLIIYTYHKCTEGLGDGCSNPGGRLYAAGLHV
jgi:hypothetical protein